MDIIKKLLGIVVLCTLFSSTSFAGVSTGYKLGKGYLKVTKDTADIIEYSEFFKIY